MKLSAEMFNDIISSLKSDGTCSHGHEKRRQARVGLRCALEIVRCGFSAKGKPLVVHVHDISLSGIGLVSPVRFEDESEFVARFARDAHSPVPILYKVKYCRKISSDLHAIGALFQRVLPDASGEVPTIGKKKTSPKASAQQAESAPTSGVNQTTSATV